MLPPVALLEGLREEPRADDLQAIYADWLEEQDSPQAYLVRLGRELTRLVRAAPRFDTPDYDAYRLRWQALDHQVREYRLDRQAAWLGTFAALTSEWDYTGGVLTHVALTVEAFAAHGAELLRLHPIRSVRLIEVTGKLDRLHPLEHLRHLRKLSLRAQKIGQDGTRELAQCPQLAQLQTLDLYLNQIDLAALTPLAHSPNLPRLADLTLAYNPLDDAAGELLADAPCWPDLARLDLRGTTIGVRGYLALARAARRHALRCLEAHVPGLDRAREDVREINARFGLHVG